MFCIVSNELREIKIWFAKMGIVCTVSNQSKELARNTNSLYRAQYKLKTIKTEDILHNLEWSMQSNFLEVVGFPNIFH